MQAALLLFLPFVAHAQTTSDKERCYAQSRKYVEDVKRGRKNVIEPRHPEFEWRGAHYDTKTQTCYVRYARREATR